jgi:predicted  nucleic acid-binding Zn-ribbon protein
MIKNDKELEITQERIRQLERQVAQIRKTETNGENYRMSATGYLAEIDRMNLEIRDYLWSIPTEQSASTA